MEVTLAVPPEPGNSCSILRLLRRSYRDYFSHVNISALGKQVLCDLQLTCHPDNLSPLSFRSTVAFKRTLFGPSSGQFIWAVQTVSFESVSGYAQGGIIAEQA